MHDAEYLRFVQLAFFLLLKTVTVVSPATFPEQPADLLHA